MGLTWVANIPSERTRSATTTRRAYGQDGDAHVDRGRGRGSIELLATHETTAGTLERIYAVSAEAQAEVEGPIVEHSHQDRQPDASFNDGNRVSLGRSASPELNTNDVAAAKRF